MSAPWLYAPTAAWRGPVVRLAPHEARHAHTVLRLGHGDEVWVTDGEGSVARARLAERDGEPVAEVLAVRRVARPSPHVVVFQAAAKGAKVEDVVDRLAQIGVAELHVFVSRRSVVRWDERRRATLERRWAARARAAAKQARSAHVMATGRPLSWAEAAPGIAAEPHAVVLWEGAERPLRSALGYGDRIAIVVGPEGGFGGDEVAELERAGAAAVTLGERVLRTENAALVAVSAILFERGAIG